MFKKSRISSKERLFQVILFHLDTEDPNKIKDLKKTINDLDEASIDILLNAQYIKEPYAPDIEYEYLFPSISLQKCLWNLVEANTQVHGKGNGFIISIADNFSRYKINMTDPRELCGVMNHLIIVNHNDGQPLKFTFPVNLNVELKTYVKLNSAELEGVSEKLIPDKTVWVKTPTNRWKHPNVIEAMKQPREDMGDIEIILF